MHKIRVKNFWVRYFYICKIICFGISLFRGPFVETWDCWIKYPQLREGWEIVLCQDLVFYAPLLNFWKIPPFYLAGPTPPSMWLSLEMLRLGDMIPSPHRAINVSHRREHTTEDWPFSSFPGHLKLEGNERTWRKLSLSPSVQMYQMKILRVVEAHISITRP